jgi:hypothetical protein
MKKIFLSILFICSLIKCYGQLWPGLDYILTEKRNKYVVTVKYTNIDSVRHYIDAPYYSYLHWIDEKKDSIKYYPDDVYKYVSIEPNQSILFRIVVKKECAKKRPVKFNIEKVKMLKPDNGIYDLFTIEIGKSVKVNHIGTADYRIESSEYKIGKRFKRKYKLKYVKCTW